MVGFSYSGSNYDAFVLKLDSRGRIKWAKDTPSTLHGTFEGVVETHDGGYLVVGDLKHSFTKRSSIIIKLDTNGIL